jgi:hypothetical protein
LRLFLPRVDDARPTGLSLLRGAEEIFGLGLIIRDIGNPKEFSFVFSAESKHVGAVDLDEFWEFERLSD